MDTATRNTLLSALFLIAAIAVVSFVRFEQFGQIQPRMDQAAFAVLIQDIVESERMFPIVRDGQSVVAALKADESNVLSVFLRRIYVAQDHIFQTVSIFSLVPRH